MAARAGPGHPSRPGGEARGPPGARRGLRQAPGLHQRSAGRPGAVVGVTDDRPSLGRGMLAYMRARTLLHLIIIIIIGIIIIISIVITISVAINEGFINEGARRGSSSRSSPAARG